MATISSLTADLNLNYAPFVSGFQKAGQVVSSSTNKMVADQQVLVKSFAQHKAAVEAVTRAAVTQTGAQRNRIAADIASYQQLAKSLQAEQAMEAQRLKAQISEKGRADSLNRSAALSRDLASTQEALAAREADLTRITEAHTNALNQNAQAANAVRSAQSTMAQQYQQGINSNLGVVTDFNTAGRAADVEAYGASLDALRAKYNPLYAASKQYENVLNEISHAENVGAISANEAATEMERQRLIFERSSGPVDKYGQSIHLAGRRAGAASGSLTQLSFQINDIASGILMGQSPFQIMAQQGGQVFQVWQMNNNIFKELKTLIAGLISPATLLLGGTAIGIGTMIAAAASYEAEQRRLTQSTQGLGRASGVTASQLRIMAEAASAAGVATIRGAEGTEVALLKTGKVYSENFAGLIGVARDFAAQTGESADDANKKLADMAADPIKGIAELAKTIGGVTAAQQERVQALVAVGRQQEAVNIITKAARDNLVDYRSNMSALGRKTDDVMNQAISDWHELGKAISDAYDNLLKYRADHPTTSMLNFLALPPPFGSLAMMLTNPSNAPAGAPNAKDIMAINRANNASEAAKASQGVTNIYGMLTQQSDLAKTLANPAGLDTGQLARVRLEYARITGQINSLKDAQGDLGVTVGNTTQSFISQQQIQRRQDELALQAVNARTPIEKAEIARQQSLLQTMGSKLTASERQAVADRAANLVMAQGIKTITDQNKVLSLNVAANIAAANAAQSGAGAVMEAAANARAANDNWQNGVDRTARANQLLQESITSRIASMSQDVANTKNQIAAQKAANDAVEAGTLRYSQMDSFVQRHVVTMELEQLRTTALSKGWKDVAAELQKYIDAEAKLGPDEALQAARNRANALLNPYGQDQDTIKALQNNKNISPWQRQYAIDQTGLGRDFLNAQQSVGANNPFGPGAAMAQDAATKGIADQKQSWLDAVSAMESADKDRVAHAQQYADARVAIEQNAAAQMLAVNTQFEDAKLKLGQDTFNDLAQGLGDMFGKQSGAYKAAFAVEKAFQLARATLALETSIAQAAAVPWPANIPAIASAISTMGQILSTISSIGFMAGGYTGNGATNQIAGVVHGQEWVTSAANVPGNTNALAAMQSGAKLDNMPTAANGNGGGTVINMPISIDARGAQKGVAEEIDAKMREWAPRIAGAAVAESKRQSPNWVAKANNNPRGRVA